VGGRDRAARRIAVVASLAATAAVTVPMALSAVRADTTDSALQVIAAADPRFPAPMPTLDDDVQLALEATPTPTPEPTSVAVDDSTPTVPTPPGRTTPPAASPTIASRTTEPDPSVRPVGATPDPTVAPSIPTPIVLPPLPPTPPPTPTPTVMAEPTATMSAPSPVVPTPDTLSGSLRLMSADRLVAGAEGRLHIRVAADPPGADHAVTVRISVDGATLVKASETSAGWSCAIDSVGWLCRIDHVDRSPDGRFDLVVAPSRPGPVTVVVVIESTAGGATLRWGGAVSVTAEPVDPDPNYTPESDPRALTPDVAAAELTTP
jgi:hypothetical protein